MRSPIVAGNWKLNGSRESAGNLAREVSAAPVNGVEVVVCPASVHLVEIAQIVAGSAVKLGAQNAASHESGAYTGEVSSSMLAEYGCEFVIIGHSERRSIFGEDSAACAARHHAVKQAGLTPIFCVGESLEERESGDTMTVVRQQLQAAFDQSGADAFAGAVVAYEPVWAIGTGKTATPEQAQEVHQAIREFVGSQHKESADALRILYGGSVKPDNAQELFAKPDIDGGLIGGAALKSVDFLAVCNAALAR